MYDESSQPTQPATQQILDPRRLGRNNSGLNDGDVADVLAILHPATPTAIKIVENAADTRPYHVLFRNSLDSMRGSLSDIEEQETIIVDSNGNRVGQSAGAGADLALRTSSAPSLRFKELGFVFGRNSNSADIVFGQDSGKRISNQHFRIYLNEDGIMMLEDMSTNGTIVDDVLLKCKDERFPKIRMLSSGSIICIQNANADEMIKFILRVPSRVTHMDRFRENLRNFMAICTPGGDGNKAVERISKQYAGPAMKWDGGEHYSIIGMLGKGAFATVYQLATKMDGKLLAGKELEKRRFMKNGILDKKADNEMRIMQGLRHPNIVDFVEYHDAGDHLYIVMEFARHGDLSSFLNQGGPMKESMVRDMAQQVLSALNYLHKAKITHRDIKPDNILIADLDPFTVKLSDFGLSKVVKADETFLKTFCGTLLYCAPEVFPDYQGAKGRKRGRGVKDFHQYSSSVDVWSFAGVLWFSLCGQPPFQGIPDNTGEAMYKNIMATPLDPTPLRDHGVSKACIDLLTRMLRTDPTVRPNARQCLMHPWLKGGATVPADPTLQSIVEEDESEPAEQLSQLKLDPEQGNPESDEEEEPEEEVLYDDEFAEMLEPKRVRPDTLYPRNQIRDGDDSSANPSFRSEQAVGEGESFKLVPTTGRPRLFGEIGQSAIQSSGILNARANNALSFDGAVASPPHGAPLPDSFTVGGAENHVSAVRGQLDGRFSSPSLQGAESMVRDLRMASPHSPISRTQSPAMPATPRTPDIIQHNSLDQGSNYPSQISEPTPKARQTSMNRQINLPHTASYYYDPMDPSTHNLEYASRVSGVDFLSARRDAEAGASAYEDTVRASSASGHSEYSTTAAAAPSPPVAAPSVAMPSVPGALDFKAPPRRLGKLTATPDSFAPGLTVTIEQSKTSWGRLPSNTVVYEDSADTRISKTAFVIFFYSSADSSDGTVDELSQHGKDWTGLDELHAGIFTMARHGISINGKHLKKTDDKGRGLFGHLHTGDIITVYQDPRAGSQCLKFKCELYLGSGKEPRPTGGSFTLKVGRKF